MSPLPLQTPKLVLSAFNLLLRAALQVRPHPSQFMLPLLLTLSTLYNPLLLNNSPSYPNLYNIAVGKSSVVLQPTVTGAALSPSLQNKSSGAGYKSSSISIDTLYSELKGISSKWHNLGGVLKIGQLEEIRALNGNSPGNVYMHC